MKMNSKKKCVKSGHGFTLIELLATIAVLALVLSIVIYFAINVVSETKKKSYKITVNEIEDEAINYVLEDISTMSWVDGSDGSYQYQCVTVQNLIDTGYFKGDVLDSYVSENVMVKANDYIYLERNKNTQAVTKNILLIDGVSDAYLGLCTDIKTLGNILFLIEPIGWSREKKVTIKYDIYNNIDKLSNYNYDYLYNDNYYKKTFNKSSMMEQFIVTSNGTIVASINDTNGWNINNTLDVSKIDRTGPIISSDYVGEEVIRNRVVIPIKLEDNQSGVDNDSFSLSDLVVTIGDKVITDGLILEKKEDNKYELTIVNNSDVGELIITIDKGMVLDLVVDEVKNGNEKTVLKPGVIFNNIYTIKYKSNGGSGSMNDTECTYGSECVLRKNTFTRTGYVFKGWSDSFSSSNVLYEDKSSFIYNSLSDMELYAVWEDNTYTITYNANGGSGAPSKQNAMAGVATTLSSKIPTKQDKDKLYGVFLGWNTKSDGTGTSYDSGASYTGNSNVTLYAQWHEHTWNARGIKIFTPGWSKAEYFKCGNYHYKAFFVYCTECGMSKQYYKWSVSPIDERSNVKNTLECPCNSGAAYSVLYDDSDLTFNQAKQYGGIYYGDKEKLDVVCNSSSGCANHSKSEKDCSEH